MGQIGTLGKGNYLKYDATMSIFKNIFGRQGKQKIEQPLLNGEHGNLIPIKHKVVCVWIGTFDSEEVFYKNYLSFNSENEEDYEDEDEAMDLPRFAKDAGLGWYDEDFIESWWFEKLEINKLQEYRAALLDSEYFFDDLIAELKTCDISNYNTITFLFGEKGTNEMLFNYEKTSEEDVPIKFVLKKQYQK